MTNLPANYLDRLNRTELTLKTSLRLEPAHGNNLQLLLIQFHLTFFQFHLTFFQISSNTFFKILHYYKNIHNLNTINLPLFLNLFSTSFNLPFLFLSFFQNVTYLQLQSVGLDRRRGK